MADGNYARLVAACSHEKPLFPTTGRQRRACYDCWPGARPESPAGVRKHRECKDCGAAVARKCQLCPACRVTRKERRDRRIRQSKPRQLYCEHCHMETIRRVSGGERDSGKYCSRQCAAARHSLVAAEIAGIRRLGREPTGTSRVFTGYCATCAQALPVTRWLRKYCSNECRPGYAPCVNSRSCGHCGTTFYPAATGGRRAAFCSETCRHLATARIRGAFNRMRKAKQRGVTVERVDATRVFERDRWRCQLCGLKLDAGKRGKHTQDAPEVDHIIPLAQGGEHSYRNVQASCRACNLRKSGTARGQLLLVG